MAESSRRSRLLWTLARVVFTAAAFGVLFLITDMKIVMATLRTFPFSAALVTIALAYAALGIGAVRWMVLMRTCGATHTPPLTRLYRLSLVGFFYSTVLPGAVSGDVVRGLATAESFEGRGATSSLAVALLERLSGLTGLLLLGSCAFLMNPLEGIEQFRLGGAVVFIVALAGITGVAFGSKLAPLLPGRLATLAAKLPEVKHPSGFALALVLSLGTQLAMTLAVHALVAAVHPAVTVLESAVVMPAVTIASYFPFTPAGAGARDLALVAVYRLVDVPAEQSAAAGIAYLGCTVVVAASGGIVSMIKPLTK
jgi:glycosyltransferase 2 family protein